MLFFTLDFFIFFLIVYTIYWGILRRPNAKLNFLLLASYFFYMIWSTKCLILLLIITIVDYSLAQAITQSQDPGRRKRLLALSVVSNLGLLTTFKYANFFLGAAGSAAHFLGSSWATPQLDIVLPIGISFYTFESLSYTIDVYRGLCRPARSLRDYAFFVSYFPHLIAGPILRARDFLPQLENLPSFSEENVLKGIDLFVLGLIKKRLIADTLAMFVDSFFLDPSHYNGITAWAAAIAYAVQIYCDFSGYTDMARGLGRMFGFDIPINFRTPYLSKNISEFWQRWHITLSTWLRDYLFYPLGGYRQSRWRGYQNLFITMLLGGLWHGANWTFVIWGVYHGLLLIALRVYQTFFKPARTALHPGLKLAQDTVKRFFVFGLVCIGWVFFRSQNLTEAFYILEKMFGLVSGGAQYLSLHNLGSLRILLFIGLVFFYDVVSYAFESLKIPASEYAMRLPPFVRALGYAGVMVVLMVFVQGSSPFIYFQF